MKNKKRLLSFGLAAGLITTLTWVISGFLIRDDEGKMDFENGELIGYAAMIIAFSMVFFGVRSYRDKERNGVITLRDAFLNGLIIVLIASLIYVIGWEIYYPNFMSDFGEQYKGHLIEGYKMEGLTEKQIAEKNDELDQWLENYKNPLIRMPITFLEIFPVGLIIAVFSALILKRRPPEGA